MIAIFKFHNSIYDRICYSYSLKKLMPTIFYPFWTHLLTCQHPLLQAQECLKQDLEALCVVQVMVYFPQLQSRGMLNNINKLIMAVFLLLRPMITVDKMLIYTYTNILGKLGLAEVVALIKRIQMIRIV